MADSWEEPEYDGWGRFGKISCGDTTNLSLILETDRKKVKFNYLGGRWLRESNYLGGAANK